MRRRLAALLLAALLGGCGGLTPVEPPAPTVPPVVDARMSAASLALGIDLLKQVYAGENALLSPVSASLVLSLTGGGARGETQQEFWRALRFDALAPEDAFAELADKSYSAAVNEAAFGTQAGTDKVSNWTAEQTRGKIEKLLEETSPDTVMVLANALCFKGAWSEAFDPKLTRGGTFTTAAGAERTLFFMERNGEWEMLTARAPGSGDPAV